MYVIDGVALKIAQPLQRQLLIHVQIYSRAKYTKRLLAPNKKTDLLGVLGRASRIRSANEANEATRATWMVEFIKRLTWIYLAKYYRREEECHFGRQLLICTAFRPRFKKNLHSNITMKYCKPLCCESNGVKQTVFVHEVCLHSDSKDSNLVKYTIQRSQSRSPSTTVFVLTDKRAVTTQEITFFLYDYLLTLPTEIEYLWKRPIEFSGVVFLIHHYCGVVPLLVQVIIKQHTPQVGWNLPWLLSGFRNLEWPVSLYELSY
ncbi:hypothetical protein BU17DRAFT_70020 [Hysterangium stoloniferum]|nr:hypothetical protein BU17DRAFT_70020 [Hysterangium stoloniferum]